MSPQCGFASTEEGNQLTEEEQWTKLKYVVELSNELLGALISTILNSKNTKLDEPNFVFLVYWSMFNKAYCLIIASC